MTLHTNDFCSDDCEAWAECGASFTRPCEMRPVAVSSGVDPAARAKTLPFAVLGCLAFWIAMALAFPKTTALIFGTLFVVAIGWAVVSVIRAWRK